MLDFIINPSAGEKRTKKILINKKDTSSVHLIEVLTEDD